MSKKYFFVFCKEDLLLEKTSDGSYTIPCGEEPPTEVKPCRRSGGCLLPAES